MSRRGTWHHGVQLWLLRVMSLHLSHSRPFRKPLESGPPDVQDVGVPVPPNSCSRGLGVWGWRHTETGVPPMAKFCVGNWTWKRDRTDTVGGPGRPAHISALGSGAGRLGAPPTQHGLNTVILGAPLACHALSEFLYPRRRTRGGARVSTAGVAGGPYWFYGSRGSYCFSYNVRNP